MRALVALLILCTFATAAVAQDGTGPADLQGWQNTRWGMTAAEVQSTLGDSASRVPEGDYWTKDKVRFAYTGFVIRDVDIADGKFNVKLLLDAKTNLLSHVFISLADQSADRRTREMYFNKLEAALTQKYGKPKYTNGDTGDSRERRWMFPTTTIQLRLVYFSVGDVFDLSYRAVVKENNL